MTKNNKIIAAIAVILVIVGGVYIYNQSNLTNTSTTNSSTGRIVAGITDAAADMGTVTSVRITVDKMEMHGAASGWVTVSNAVKEYDLLALKASGKVSLYSDTTVPVGTYEQARLSISNVTVVANGQTHTAKLPSGTLHIVGRTVVTSEGTAALVFDFIADKSLHVTGSGQFIFAPVVKFTSESSSVVIIDGDSVNTTAHGKTESNMNFGVDEKGETKADFELDADLDIDADGIIKIGDHDDDHDEVVVTLRTENNSGISGKATFEEEDGKVKVELELTSRLTLPEPAHIHVGSCPGVGAVKYPLNSVVNGKSETTINATLAGLKAELPLAINVHKSAAESSVYIACGEINL